MRGFARIAVLGLAAAVGWGCSDSDGEGGYKLVKVTGIVTRNGKPLADAGVSFIPDAGNKNSTPGVDRTGQEGNYKATFKGRTGIAPGKYKVIITPPMELPPGVTVPAGLENQPFELQRALEARHAAKKKMSREAKKEVAKSTFDREVADQAGGVTLDFDVKSSVAKTTQ